jgi:hypothetical protein
MQAYLTFLFASKIILTSLPSASMSCATLDIITAK